MAKSKKSMDPKHVAFRASILKRKIKVNMPAITKTTREDAVKGNKPVTITVKSKGAIGYHLHYAQNCYFWINEYLAGRTDKKELLEAVKHLRKHMESIEIILKKELFHEAEETIFDKIEKAFKP